MRIRYLPFLATLFSSPALCDPVPATGIYKGEYFYNFENSVLTPTGTSERWCLSGDMSKAELPAKGASGRWGTADVVVRGELGPVGSYGGLGACSRVLTVKEVVSVANKKSRD